MKSKTRNGRAPSLALQLEMNRLDLMYQQCDAGVAGFVICSLAYLAVAWPSLPHSFLLTWFAAILILGIARIWSLREWRGHRLLITAPEDTGRYLRRLTAILVGTALAWIPVSWIMAGTNSPELQLVSSLILIFASAGAVVAYSVSRTAATAFVICTLAPWNVGIFYYAQGPTDYILGGVIFLFILIGLGVARRLNNFVNNALRLTIENARLAEDLRGEIQVHEAAKEALRESEKRLRLTLETTLTGSWSWDLKSGLIVCDHLFKGAQATQWKGSLNDYLNLVHPDDRRRVRNLRVALEASALEIDDEHRVLFSDGKYRFMWIRGHVQRDTEGQVHRCLGVCWDMTERREKEKLQRERDISNAANRAKSMFLASVSHELRTPLAAINGFAEILSTSGAGEDVEEASRRILKNGKYLASLMDDLLDLSKIETGRLYLQKTVFDWDSEIEDAIMVVKNLILHKGLKFRFQHGVGIPQKIESDPVRFRQILINLLSNAVKYTSEGEISVRVSFKKTSSSSGILRVLVRDTGIGMDDDAKAKLFEPFVRGENPAVQSVSGSGLGMVISKNLARLLGGDVRLVRSTPGRGTEFELSLVVGISDSSLQLPDQKPQKAEVRLENTRVLLVEDSEDIREIVTHFLESKGILVETAENGAEAIARIQKMPYQLILMDINMPVKDGFAATRELRAAGFQKPIVALTAHAGQEDRRRCIDVGCNDCLVKPIDSQQLMEVIRRQVSLSESIHPRQFS